MFQQTPEQRQLLFDRNVFVQYLFKSWNQPTDGRSAGPDLERVDVEPMARAQVMQQSQTGQQSRKGLALIKRPSQPGANPKIPGLGTKEALADFEDFQPVGLSALVQGPGFAQLTLQVLVFTRIASVLSCKFVLEDRRLCKIQIVFRKFAGVIHTNLQLGTEKHLAAINSKSACLDKMRSTPF
ncbi:hypothetical protein D3C84_705240 [compost metagenome]